MLFVPGHNMLGKNEDRRRKKISEARKVTVWEHELDGN
jgi:ribosome-associated protein YbcJ (S4-like RNA binding protein)